MPHCPQYTTPFTDELEKLDIPYIYIDSNIKEAPALSFFGQNSHQSGYFAARMLMLLAGEDAQEIVIFRKINEGIVVRTNRNGGKSVSENICASIIADASGNWICTPNATVKMHRCWMISSAPIPP
mgnify:CR=1 FL=1